LRISLTLILLAALGARAADGPIFIEKQLSFEPNPTITDAAKLECGGMAGHVGKPLLRELIDTVPGARLLDDQVPGPGDRVLKLRIADVRGGDSGPAYQVYQVIALLEVRADIYKESKLVATKVFRRRSNAVGVPDMCGVKEKLASVVGRDIAGWLELGESENLIAKSMAIQLPVSFDPDSAIPEAARNECNVAELVGRYALLSVKRSVKDLRPVSATEASAQGRVLKISITGFGPFAQGGGEYGRSITIRADLLADGTLVASNTFNKAVASAIGQPCLNADGAARVVVRELAVWLGPGSPAAAEK
jgi:hypothetical protein